MELREVNPIEELSWDDWVLEHEACQVFHSSSWVKVLHETYGYEPRCMVLREPGDEPGLFPLVEVDSMITGRRAVCLPFSDQCAPLVRSPEAFEALLEACSRLGRERRWRYIEWREESAAANGIPPWSDWIAHRLSLERSEERQWSRLRPGNKRNIRKAERHGVEVLRLGDLESVTAYYRLHCRTRKRHGLPPQPIRFFRKIHEHLIDAGKGFVMLARWEGRWIAGAIFFQFGSKALYKFGASDLAFWHLRPNNLLMWEAIRHFRQEGFSSFSFGRTSPYQEGLLRFKRAWGADEERIHYYRLDLRGSSRRARKEGDSSSRALLRGIMRRMPVFALRMVGELGYRHLG